MQVSDEMVEAAAQTLSHLDESFAAIAKTRQLELMRQALTAAIAAQAGMATHRHKKRGSDYVLMGVGKIQTETWLEPSGDRTEAPAVGASVDMRDVALYRSVDDGALWVRPIEEFNDGRFIELGVKPQSSV
ncbi:hypothetical protein ACFSE1_02190 [Rhizobium helianthi]|uniref:DUF1653 domain-containing protein n=1 Tax=Rhizobium helianthi TaxID=1132695 RepID=A0ABW4LYM1_9HYPH